MNCEVKREYVHEKILLDTIQKSGERYQKKYKKHNIGEMKDPSKYKIYHDFYTKKYKKMREKIEGMEFDINNVDSFEDAAKVLNEYWKSIKTFMKDNKISHNSKFHTNFLEEFSIYFLKSIPHINQFDVFVNDVFAGLKITSDCRVKQITKNVDFCIGRRLTDISFPEQEPMDFNIPVLTVECKSYVDATMLGEIMNTSRKIKGANPGSKAVLLTWINSFAEEHALEAAYDSSIDEIVVMSSRKREKNKPIIIEFTKEGLRDYYVVMVNAMNEIMITGSMPKLGRVLSYVRHVNGNTETGV